MPRVFQLETRATVYPRALATAHVPPSSPMTATESTFLNMTFSVQQDLLCSNIACKKFIMPPVHETAKRLLQLGQAMGDRDFTAVARRFGASDQSATNWKTRGVPQTIVIKAAALWRVDPAWLANIPGAAMPAILAQQTTQQSNYETARATAILENGASKLKSPPCPGYGLSGDEQTLLSAYRQSDQGSRDALMWIARMIVSRKPNVPPRRETQ